MTMKQIAIPLNVPHISERYGLFVMIILGEALISVMTQETGKNLTEIPDDGEWYEAELIRIIFYLMIFILTYYIGKLYFNCQPSEEAIMEDLEGHALRTSKNMARLYIHSHHVLFIALLAYVA